MTVACVGITVLDRIFRVDHLPKAGGKYVARDYFEVGGGPAATAAVAIAKLGMAVDYIGRVGNDDVAASMIRELSQYGVGTRHIRTIQEAKSSFSAILVDDEGERMIINYQDATLDSDAKWLKEINFAQYESILCDVRWPAGAKHALEQAKQLQKQSVLDADITPQDITELVALADHVAFSEPGLAKFSQLDDPIDGLRVAQTKTNGKVYVTVGSKGCYWLEGNTLHHQPGFKVDVKDTTGAGDVFHGAFAFALAKGMAIKDIVAFASAVAALKCTRLGGRDGVPDLATIDAFLAANG